MKRKEKKVSVHYVRNHFSLIGLTLILYTLFVLYLPFLLTELVTYTPSAITKSIYIQPNILIGLLYIIVLFGTMIPFGLLQAGNHIKFSEFCGKCSIKFKDFFIYTIVFVAGILFAMFITSVLANYLPIGSTIFAAIGIVVPKDMMMNPIYFVLFTLLVPVIEEYAFRGVLLRSLGRYGNYFALIIVSGLYGFVHGSIASAIVAYFMSTMLVRITLKYRSIQPAIAMHILFNILLYGFEAVPLQYSMVVTVIILAFYVAAIYLYFSNHFKFIRVKNKYKQSIIWKLFFTNGPIIISFILVIVYMVVNNFNLI